MAPVALSLGPAVLGCSTHHAATTTPRSATSRTLTIPPAVTTSTVASSSRAARATTTTVAGPVVMLDGDGPGAARFGQSQAVAATEPDNLLGAPSTGPVNEHGDCTVDAAEQWPDLTAYFDAGAFVGYSTLAANGEALSAGNMETARGLRVGQTMAQAESIYGPAFSVSYAQGGSWSLATSDGKLDGYLSGVPNEPGPTPVIASIEAGPVGCPAASP